MEIPKYQPFYLHSRDDLRKEVARLGLDIPVAEDVTALFQPLRLGDKAAPNRFCAQPITGCDGTNEGAPGALTLRRYQRYAAGGFGMIWFESTTAGDGEDPSRLRLNEQTVEQFRGLVSQIKEAASAGVIVILQLASSIRDGSDEEIAGARAQLVKAAALAARAGFDGVDLQASPRTLAGTLLKGTARGGHYGGSLENRMRFLLETVAEVRNQRPELLCAVRLCAYEAARGGFGVSPDDYRRFDPSEPIELVRRLKAAGIAALNVTAASPNLRGPVAERATAPFADADWADEHPLMTLDRQLQLSTLLRAAAPGLPVVASGFSWLRSFAPHVAAGVIARDGLDFVGLGRGALAYPDLPNDLYRSAAVAADSTCMICFACEELRRSQKPVGCVIRDGEFYGEAYRESRRFDSDQLISGAARCHLCESAPCITACPTRTDIPRFIEAYRNGNDAGAYEVIRRRDLLPELTSQLSPRWLESEGACIEAILTGTPVPILDLQYSIAWQARQRGETGVRVPSEATGKTIAVIGGGSAGVAATARLVELGHRVLLYEATNTLGGVPERVIPTSRLPDLQGEIEALLAPAQREGRLELHLGTTIGKTLTLDSVRIGADAVLVATGLWQERRLGHAPGVTDGLAFLETAKRNSELRVPPRVVLLAGGDSAMDCARILQNRGASELFVVFGGPRSAMHWHMPESWFASPGVHLMVEWQPLEYVVGTDGAARGLRIRQSGLAVESVLEAELFVEAMGLEIAESSRKLIDAPGVYLAGAVHNGGASVAHCVAEGMAMAEQIHADLMV